MINFDAQTQKATVFFLICVCVGFLSVLALTGLGLGVIYIVKWGLGL